MSEPLVWRFLRWMCQPSKLKRLAWRFFFWITPRWLSRKWQMYMLRRVVERYPAEVDRSLRESAKRQAQSLGAPSEEELVALYKRGLDAMLHPPARKRGFSQIGPHP